MSAASLSAQAVDVAAVRVDWARRGFSFEDWRDPPGQNWRDFVHPTDELLMLVDGALEVTFGGRTLRPAPGEEVLIPAGARHDVRNVGSGPNRWLFGYKR